MATVMTPTQKRLFKEAVIREYKIKYEKAQKKKPLYNVFVRRLKRITAINVIVGITASIILLYWRGWDTLAITLLSAIIWITLVGTLLSAFLKTN